jgi:hypothetical protein
VLKTCKSNGKAPFGGYTSGARVSNTWVIYLRVWDNSGKLELIPDKTTRSSDFAGKDGLSLEAIACR